jgi:hypothetical protein
MAAPSLCDPKQAPTCLKVITIQASKRKQLYQCYNAFTFITSSYMYVFLTSITLHQAALEVVKVTVRYTGVFMKNGQKLFRVEYNFFFFFITIIIIIIIIIGPAALGVLWPPQANVASELYPWQPPANFYHPVSLRLLHLENPC